MYFSKILNQNGELVCILEDKDFRNVWTATLSELRTSDTPMIAGFYKDITRNEVFYDDFTLYNGRSIYQLLTTGTRLLLCRTHNAGTLKSIWM